MEYIQLITTAFKNAANKQEAAGMKKYMRDQFEYFGLKAPLRRRIQRAIKAQHGVPPISEMSEMVRELWELPEREYQYAAMDIMQAMHKQFQEEHIGLFEFMICTKSWWDTVDNTVSGLAGPWFRKFPALRPAITDSWVNDADMWLQRSAIIYQNGWKKDTDEKVLFRYILEHIDSKEFFIQKAIGWALREYSKVNPQAVQKFADAHLLAALSRREALRRIL
ncbi:MAG: DNA alkylation repair protein [Chitinophaga sp.]|uniref:DNA alkylation repair protein n=1 Tax=Chitinophaga sp. TaxID=1869181 RepID=UPI0025BDC380|nr:DNA alkylation repair protein [Chitinophaga sp.]MBV8254901.1 DNA alkylation repair protein [Chitinophaga sp.]